MKSKDCDRLTVIHQPDFLPYIGFFHRLVQAGVFIVLDNAQYVRGTKNSWMNRDKIKTSGGAKWLTVSVKKCPHNTQIRKVELNDDVDWRERNLNMLNANYHKAPYFEPVFKKLEKIYTNRNLTTLVDFNMATIVMVMEMLDIRIELHFASDFKITTHSNQRLVDLLAAVQSKHYLSGTGARDYYDPGPFDEAGITVHWQRFEHPVYPQLFGNFVPYLSIVDLLMNSGAEDAAKLIKNL